MDPSQIPTDVALGLPAGAVIMILVALLERANFVPNRFAGLVAIAIATVLGTIGLYLAMPPATATTNLWMTLGTDFLKSFVWGCMIVIAHSSIVDPLKDPTAPNR